MSIYDELVDAETVFLLNACNCVESKLCRWAVNKNTNHFKLPVKQGLRIGFRRQYR